MPAAFSLNRGFQTFYLANLDVSQGLQIPGVNGCSSYNNTWVKRTHLQVLIYRVEQTSQHGLSRYFLTKIGQYKILKSSSIIIKSTFTTVYIRIIKLQHLTILSSTLGLPNKGIPKKRVQDTELAVILPIPRSAPDMMCCVVSGKPAWRF